MKNKIKKLLFAWALIGGFAFLHAQKIETKAKDILESVSAHYKSKKNLYFQFTYGTGMSKVSHTEPGIFYSTPTQYRFKVMGNEQIFDGKKIYNISKEDQEVTIAKPNGSEKALSPIHYLDEYKNGYTVSYMGKKGGLDLIKMIPTKDRKIKNILLYINNTKKQITKVVQTSIQNEVTAISINQYKENQNLDASVFSFEKSKYKNYLITEL